MWLNNVVEQTEVVDLAKQDAENADVKKEYYLTKALKAAKKANDTTNT